MTRRLWRALHQPTAQNAIFRRARPERQLWVLRLVEVIAFLLVAPILVIPAAVYGVGFAATISGGIARLHANGLYDLYAVTQGGALEIHWYMATGTLHQNPVYMEFNARNTWAGRAAVLLVLFFILFLAPRSTSPAPLLTPLLGLIAGAAVIYLDHVQSIVVCVLAGMLAPTFAREGFNAQASAMMLYLSVQFGVYGASLMAALLLLPARDMLPLELTLRLMIAVGVLYVLREAAIRVLWRALLARVNATDEEGARLIDAIPLAPTLPTLVAAFPTGDEENTENS